MVAFSFSMKIRTSGYKYIFNSSDTKFSTLNFRNRVPFLKLTLKTEYVLHFCSVCTVIFTVLHVLFWEITHYAMGFLYSSVFMEVMCSAKASKHLNNEVFHILQIRSPKVINFYFLKWERIRGVMTHTSWFFGNTYVEKLA